MMPHEDDMPYLIVLKPEMMFNSANTSKPPEYVEEVKMKTAFSRATRTALQLVAGGGLTALVTALSNGLAPETTVIVMAANTVVVTYVQNLLEDLGWVKPILK